MPLAELSLSEGHAVGAKAVNLARLARRGLPVPAGFVIPCSAYEATLASSGLLSQAEKARQQPSRETFAAMRRALMEVPLPPDWQRWMVGEASRLGSRLAVRSSGIDEDGAERSFAGQHHTSLGLRPAEVPRAIRACWASLYSERALAYRSHSGLGPPIGAMGVIVQQLVDPRVSGVLFTINPLNGSWREMILESTWGLCEGLVSGRVAPHWTLVRRPRQAPGLVRRITSRLRLKVMQEDLPAIHTRWVVRRGEVIEEHVPETLVDAPTLTRRELHRVCRMGLEIEAMLGGPQDIEWAIGPDEQVYVLQSRPVTSTARARPRQDVLWTRRFIGERWPTPASVLGWSIMGPVLEHFIAYPDTQRRYLGGGPALKLVDGRPFINATIFRHLAFKLPGSPAPRFMLDMVPPEEEQAWQRSFAVMPSPGVYASILRESLRERRWRRFHWNPLTNPRRWQDFDDQLRDALPRLSRSPVSLRDALRTLREQREWIVEYVGIHVMSLLYANVGYQGMDSLLASWLPQRRTHLLPRLATCPPGNETVATNAALNRLARAASPADLEALSEGRWSGAFGEQLAAFLAARGHRAAASWEVFSPRWRDQPATLVPILKSQQTTEDPLHREERQEAAFREACAELREELDAPRAALVLSLARLTRTYLLLRENQRFSFDRLLLCMRDSFVWIGERWVEQGWLDAPADIQHLTWDEVEALCNGELMPEDLAEDLPMRRRAAALHATAEPPVFLSEDDRDLVHAPGRRLQGLGISAGRATGSVRVLDDLAQADRFQPGEVLVARAVDPAWTPLFLQASAVILELGSQLSHGAVVAREYQLPGVANLEGITRRLNTGMRVTVDGTRGAVWIHDPGD